MTLPPLLTAHLLPPLHAKLIELLRSLDDDEWEFQTVAPGACRAEAERQARVTGDADLGRHVLEMSTVVG